MESIRRFFARLALFLKSLQPWQRWSLFAAAALVMGLMALFVFLAGRITYEPLFTGLEVEDQSSIVAYLRENGISYQLDPTANAIMLPRDQVYEVRLSLAQEGLPKGGSSGFEIFDDNKIGMSEFQQRVTYMRALEGELQRTIKQMDAIDYARVNIVIPEQRLFLEQEKPSTASVMLRLKKGMQLGPIQVKGIIHLLSHSVDGLLPENVTVVDTSGRILSDMVGDDLFIYPSDAQGAVTSVQRELERQREKELENKARMMLEQVFGPGAVVVRVKVDLDFDKKSTSLKEFAPDPETGRGVPRSLQRTDEAYTGQGQNGAATPNIPGYSATPRAGGADYSKSDTITNYDITTRESSEVVTPGSIKRVSASVLVDGELDDARLTELRDIVSSAIGYSKERGDSLVVKSMKFSTALADTLAEEFRKDRVLKIVTGLLIAFLMILCGFMIGLLVYRRRKARLAAEQILMDAKHVPTIQEMLASPELLSFQGEMAVLEEQLKAYARSNPAEVAALIREWLSSDE